MRLEMPVESPRRIFETYSCRVSSTQPPGAESNAGSTALEVPEPLELPLVPFAIAGMALWALAGLILLPFHGTLAEHGHTNWLWICLAGFLIGFPGLAVMIRHDAHRRDRLAGQAAEQAGQTAPTGDRED
jgi:hypothetical protein